MYRQVDGVAMSGGFPRSPQSCSHKKYYLCRLLWILHSGKSLTETFSWSEVHVDDAFSLFLGEEKTKALEFSEAVEQPATNFVIHNGDQRKWQAALAFLDVNVMWAVDRFSVTAYRNHDTTATGMYTRWDSYSDTNQILLWSEPSPSMQRESVCLNIWLPSWSKSNRSCNGMDMSNRCLANLMTSVTFLAYQWVRTLICKPDNSTPVWPSETTHAPGTNRQSAEGGWSWGNNNPVSAQTMQEPWSTCECSMAWFCHGLEAIS